MIELSGTGSNIAAYEQGFVSVPEFEKQMLKIYSKLQ
jgi:hypothetical protein